MERKIGVKYFLEKEDGRPYLFEQDNGLEFHFPCSSCANREKEDSFCKKCVHWVKGGGDDF